MVFHCSFNLYFFLLVMNVSVSLYIKGCLIPFSEICLYFSCFSVGLLVLTISRSPMNVTGIFTTPMTRLLNTVVQLFVICLLTLLITTFALLTLSVLLLKTFLFCVGV